MSVDGQLATSQVPVAYLAALDFTTGVQRLTTWNFNVQWGGYTWYGLGLLCNLGKVSSSERPAYPAVDMSLSVDSTMLALARGNVTNYRGRSAQLWRYVMGDDHQYTGEPDLIWVGEMSQVRIDTGDGRGGTITMRCEARGRSQHNSESLRLVSAQHELRFPGDTALRRKEALIAKPQLWLSKKFQQV